MKKYWFVLFAFCCIILSSCGDFQDIVFSGIENVTVTSLSKKGVEATVTARIKNPNKVGFTIYKSEMDVNIGGIDAGKAYITSNVRIKAKSEESYTFNIKSDFSNLGFADMLAIAAMAMSKHAEVKIKGMLNVGKLFVKRSFPIDITRSVPLSGQE